MLEDKNKKRKIGNIPYIYPIPMALVGANVHGKPNFELVGDLGLMGIKPALVYISSGNTHYTNVGILENNTFSINFPRTDMLALAEHCGTVSGRDEDKSGLFEVFYGELQTAPLIQECPVNLECKVMKEFSIQHRQIFVAEVVQTYVDDSLVEEKNGNLIFAELAKFDPIIYTLGDRYYRIGKSISVGNNRKRRKTRS